MQQPSCLPRSNKMSSFCQDKSLGQLLSDLRIIIEARQEVYTTGDIALKRGDRLSEKERAATAPERKP